MSVFGGLLIVREFLSLAIILVIVYVIPMNVFSENLTYYIKVYIIQINLAKRFVVENWFS